MQRLHTSYPTGTPGAALVLLRLSIASLPFVSASERMLLLDSPLLLLSALGVGTALCAGIATEVSGALALGLQAAILYRSRSGDIGISIIFIALCLTTSMLGAGHYSIDGLLYGRKRVHLPAPVKRMHGLQ